MNVLTQVVDLIASLSPAAFLVILVAVVAAAISYWTHRRGGRDSAGFGRTFEVRAGEALQVHDCSVRVVHHNADRVVLEVSKNTGAEKAIEGTLPAKVVEYIGNVDVATEYANPHVAQKMKRPESQAP